jgi:hypothetical protein
MADSDSDTYLAKDGRPSQQQQCKQSRFHGDVPFQKNPV